MFAIVIDESSNVQNDFLKPFFFLHKQSEQYMYEHEIQFTKKCVVLKLIS